MDGVFVVLIILCACVITRELGMTGYTKRCLIGLCCGVMGYFLSGYLVVHAYRIKKKINLVLGGVAHKK